MSADEVSEWYAIATHARTHLPEVAAGHERDEQQRRRLTHARVAVRNQIRLDPGAHVLQRPRMRDLVAHHLLRQPLETLLRTVLGNLVTIATRLTTTQ